MLERLLGILQSEGTCTVDELARRLEVTRPLVEMMIEDLVRMGHLSSTATACPQHCDGCSTSACHTTGDSGRLWTWAGKE